MTVRVTRPNVGLSQGLTGELRNAWRVWFVVSLSCVLHRSSTLGVVVVVSPFPALKDTGAVEQLIDGLPGMLLRGGPGPQQPSMPNQVI